MSADLLREAAKVMRERAEAATPGEWMADEIRGGPSERYQPAVLIDRGGSAADLLMLGDMAKVGDAEHIVSWNPAVALAVADWLDGVALFVEAKDDEEYFDLDGDPIAAEDTHAIGSALAVARAYLGRSA